MSSDLSEFEKMLEADDESDEDEEIQDENLLKAKKADTKLGNELPCIL